MYIQVRTIDGKKSVTLTASKSTKINKFKKLVHDKLGVPVGRQRLFFRGKQLENCYTLLDYGINLNDVVQLMEAYVPVDGVSVPEKKVESVKTAEPCKSKYFDVDDYVDAKDAIFGAWFQGRITGIYTGPEQDSEDGLLYRVVFSDYLDAHPVNLNLKDLRPRARTTASDIKVGDVVMVNYNIDDPGEIGFWYDLVVTDCEPTIKGTLMVGSENVCIQDCTISHPTVFNIEPTKLAVDRTRQESELMKKERESRVHAPFCDLCKDNPTVKCRECGCNYCGGKNDLSQQLICDECGSHFDLNCVPIALREFKEGEDWYCPECKNDDSEIVRPGQKLKTKTQAEASNSKRDWGKGMACVGRTKKCTLVPPNHFGPIPGIEVGTTWKFRIQVAECGVHRPHVAGIHGRYGEGAYSIVLSGGYEDDIDNGEEFIYTGSGGRDLSGNKRTAGQSCDQTLTRMNKALALNCNTELNTEGAEAVDWRNGKPVRVVRNFKLGKCSEYAPPEGNRYDGIYKVVKYFREKGKSGFLVWRYLLKRDDPSPAPWTIAGRNRISALGLEMEYPDGYMTADDQGKENVSKKRGLATAFNSTKKLKVAPYQLDSSLEQDISQDKHNSKLWDFLKQYLQSGKKHFLDKVEEEFMCICCQDLVFRPVGTPCHHNICISCLQRSFDASVFTCPACRFDFGPNFEMVENVRLTSILISLFPGYNVGR